MNIIGIPASKGIAICKGYRIKSKHLVIPDSLIENPLREIAVFDEAIKLTIKDLQEIRDKTAIDIDEDHAMIFDAYIEFADDPDIHDQVIDLINRKHFNSAYALKEVSKTYEAMFLNMEDGYLKERVEDFRNVMRRIQLKLIGDGDENLHELNERKIIIAEDLSPTYITLLDKKNIAGIVTDKGSKTSHVAIIADTLGIPFVIGTKSITKTFKDNQMVIVDGYKGIVIVDPTKKEVLTYHEKKLQYIQKEKKALELINEVSLSKDGKLIELAANISGPLDIQKAVSNGADGVGLYRTEFLYMDKEKLPTEEEQFNDYKHILLSMNNKKVIIRTLDIGGDKQLKYLPLDKELNPFLGKRAIRLCFDHISIFKTQLRALLRASVFGDLHIMFPMIATIPELRKARKILKECEAALHFEGYKTSNTFKVGMMVEIPSVAILADKFAEEVDFFSIGTNDLIQYTFAADRMNENVAYLYQPLNPSILRLIRTVIDAAHNKGIWVGVCGESASSDKAVPLLLGLGIDELSMNASSILTIRSLIRNVSYQELKVLANNCLDMESEDEVDTALSEYLTKHIVNI